LNRLPMQATLYSQVFDRVTLVTAQRHLGKAVKTIPPWWGVMIAVGDADRGVTLLEAKPSERNPAVDRLQLARLLWRPEALRVLERYAIDLGVRSRPFELMAARLADKLSTDELAREVRATLKARTGWLGQHVGDKR